MILGILIGLFLGAFVGFFISALCAAGKRLNEDDDWIERQIERNGQ